MPRKQCNFLPDSRQLSAAPDHGAEFD